MLTLDLVTVKSQNMKYDDAKSSQVGFGHPARGAVRDASSEPNAVNKMKRLTIDVPADLHTSIKIWCAQHDTKMSDTIRQMLMEKFGSC